MFSILMYFYDKCLKILDVIFFTENENVSKGMNNFCLGLTQSTDSMGFQPAMYNNNTACYMFL